MIDVRVGRELRDFVAVRDDDGGAAKTSDDLKMMASGNRAELCVRAVHDDARASARAAALMQQQITRQLGAMVVRSAEHHRRPDEQRGRNRHADGEFWERLMV